MLESTAPTADRPDGPGRTGRRVAGACDDLKFKTVKRNSSPRCQPGLGLDRQSHRSKLISNRNAVVVLQA